MAGHVWAFFWAFALVDRSTALHLHPTPHFEHWALKPYSEQVEKKASVGSVGAWVFTCVSRVLTWA